MVSAPVSREQLWPLGPGDALLAGGTWLFSEPQPHLRRLVDITGLGWPPVVLDDTGIELAATCTIAEVARRSASLPADWVAAPLLRRCCTALLALFKIWESATIGGNIGAGIPAGAMIVACADCGDYEMPVAEFVTGMSTNVMAFGDVLRSMQLPAAGMRARTAFFASWRPRRWAGPVSWSSDVASPWAMVAGSSFR